MISLGRSHPGRLSALLLLAAAAAVAAFALPGVATAAKKPVKKKPPKVVGHVYSETNGTGKTAPANQVIFYNRYSNGSLKKVGAVSTGGKGGFQPQPGCMPPGGCPILDTQGEVELSDNSKLLFVVNAGSDNITSFQVTKTGGLKRVSLISSGGKFPNSLTVHGHWLYVLNSDSDNIAGFTFTPKGKLTPIAGSTQPLVGGALPGPPRQVGFDNTGKVLMVTLLANSSGPPPGGGTKNTFDTFPVNSHGKAGAGTAHDSTGKFPFAFAFDKQNQAIMAQVEGLVPQIPGTAQRYTAAGVPVGPSVTTVGVAPCWVVVTKDGRHTYIVNTAGGGPGGATVAQYKISKSGVLTRLVNSKARAEFVLTDEALTGDNRYLYVLSPLEMTPGSASAPGGTSHVDEFRVLKNGRLQFIGQTAPAAIPGLSGIAAT